MPSCQCLLTRSAGLQVLFDNFTASQKQNREPAKKNPAAAPTPATPAAQGTPKAAYTTLAPTPVRLRYLSEGTGCMCLRPSRLRPGGAIMEYLS